MTRHPLTVVAIPLLFFGAFAARPTSGLTARGQDPGLTSGIRQVNEGDFEGAVAALGPVADRLRTRGGHEAAQACLYLGIAHLALDQRDAARARFGEALGHEPSLRLGPDRFSPKVIAAFEEARRAREAEARAARPAEPPSPQPKSGHRGRTALIAGGAVAAGVGIALAASGGDEPPASGAVTLTGASFGTPVLQCADGTAAAPLAVAIDLSAQNGGGRDEAIEMLTAVLTIVSSPVVPGEVGFASNQPAVVSPSVVRPGTSALRVQTTLTCANGAGDASRFNEWRGRVTLTIAGSAKTIETVDTLRVNLP